MIALGFLGLGAHCFNPKVSQELETVQNVQMFPTPRVNELRSESHMARRLTGSCSGRYPLEHWVWQKSKWCLLWISCSSVTTGRKWREPLGWRVCSWQGTHTNSQTEMTEDTQAAVQTGRHDWRFVFLKWLYRPRKGTLHSCGVRQAFCPQRAVIISLIVLKRDLFCTRSPCWGTFIRLQGHQHEAKGKRETANHKYGLRIK